MTPQAITQRLLTLDSGAICDVLDTLGYAGQVLSPALRPVHAGMRLAGPVACIRGSSAAGGAAVPPPAGKAKPAFEIDRHLTAGCIALIETGRHREGAIIGGNVSQSYLEHGCRGAIVDGPVRDVGDFVRQAFPVFATGLSPLSSKGRFVFIDYGVPITMPGHTRSAVRVDPGDYAFADGEGCVIVPQALAEQVVADAERLMQVEAVMQSELQAGEDREAVYARHNPRAHITVRRP